MDINRKKTIHIGKENNCEHFNKKEDSLPKDRLHGLKRHLEERDTREPKEHKEPKDARELRALRNSKEVRGPTRSVLEKGKGELKPLV